MTTEVIQAVNEIGQRFEEFKKANDAALAEMAKKGHVDSLLNAQVEKLNDAISKAEEAKAAAEEAQALAKRRQEVSNQLESSKSKMSEEEKAVHSAFMKYMRGGNDNLSASEKEALVSHSKAMGTFEGPDGGYAVMPELDRAIVQIVRETSPIRQYAEVLTISSDRIEEPYEGDDFDSGWIGEEATRDETNTGKLNMIAIDVHEQYAMPAISQKLIDDAYFNIEDYVINKLASKLARTENTAFVTGDGIKKPRGFTTYTTGTSFNQIEQVITGSAAAVTADGLIELVGSLKADYLPGAIFMMKRSTVTAIRKLKDDNNNYLWGPGLNGSLQSTLLGHPVVAADDMAAVASNALCIAFGDFRSAYRIVDRIGTRILRDPYTKKGYVRLYTTKRVGGGVKNFEAIKLQKCST